MDINLNFDKQLAKELVFLKVEDFLISNGFKIVTIDKTRPWGGYFVIEESQAPFFEKFFFQELSKSNGLGKLSPKLLIVESGKKLSWQYHYRRAELWKFIGGTAGVKRSNNDEEGELEIKKLNDIIFLKQGERHRLVGLSSWGIIAEMWQHTDLNNPSDEDDIIRLQDDYGR